MASGDIGGFMIGKGRGRGFIARERAAAETNSSAIAAMIEQMSINNANAIREEVEQKKESMPMTKDVLVGDDDRLESDAPRRIVAFEKKVQELCDEMWKEELNRRDDTAMCTVCFMHPAGKVLLLPCGHANTCEECAAKITRCTLCQQNVPLQRRLTMITPSDLTQTERDRIDENVKKMRMMKQTASMINS